MVGVPFAKRFRINPTTPAKRQRRRIVHIHELSPEAVTRIIRHLNVVDMHSCRVAELVPKSSAGWIMVREDFLKKIRALQQVRNIVHRKVADSTPLEFAGATRLTLALPFGGTLPLGIQHMFKLRQLDISARHGRSIDSVPKVLTECTQISKLRIRRQMFKQFPSSVLQLKMLSSLDMSKCTRLISLPNDIGRQLPKLRMLNIKGCSEITILPTSLLHTLEECSTKYFSRDEPLKCTASNFAKGYLGEIIDAKKYPNLAKKCNHLIEENEMEREEENGDGSASDEQVDIDVQAI